MGQRNIRSINKKGPAPERSEKSKSNPHKRSRKRDGRLCRQASRPRQTNGQQADFGHIWKEDTHKALAPPACTQPIQGMVWSRVKDSEDMVWGGERGKIYF